MEKFKSLILGAARTGAGLLLLASCRAQGLSPIDCTYGPKFGTVVAKNVHNGDVLNIDYFQITQQNGAIELLSSGNRNKVTSLPKGGFVITKDRPIINTNLVQTSVYTITSTIPVSGTTDITIQGSCQ